MSTISTTLLSWPRRCYSGAWLSISDRCICACPMASARFISSWSAPREYAGDVLRLCHPATVQSVRGPSSASVRHESACWTKQLAGALMWVPVLFVFGIAISVCLYKWLGADEGMGQNVPSPHTGSWMGRLSTESPAGSRERIFARWTVERAVEARMRADMSRNARAALTISAVAIVDHSYRYFLDPGSGVLRRLPTAIQTRDSRP